MKKYILEFNEIVDDTDNFFMQRHSFNDLLSLLNYLKLNFYIRDDVSRITNFEVNQIDVCNECYESSVPRLFS